VLAPVLLLSLLMPSPAPASPAAAGAPLVGFSFSPRLAANAGLEPATALRTLLRKLHPDLVRLPIYWDQVAPAPDSLDFGSVDALLKTVADYDAARPGHDTRVLLVVGARNIATPEVYLPGWLDAGTPPDLGRVTSSDAYFGYLEACFYRYSGNRLLYAWQVENEPLDSTNDDLGDIAMESDAVAGEVALLKQIDAAHPVVVTTFNSATAALDRQATSRLSWLYRLLPVPQPAGHPAPALEIGDVLGLDIYVVTPSTPLAAADAEKRIGWKADAVDYWLQQAHKDSKQVWITEMQASPWNGHPGFTTQDLAASAQAYSKTGVGVVLLWGVEDWLSDADWMTAGREAIATLRAA